MESQGLVESCEGGGDCPGGDEIQPTVHTTGEHKAARTMVTAPVPTAATWSRWLPRCRAPGCAAGAGS